MRYTLLIALLYLGCSESINDSCSCNSIIGKRFDYSGVREFDEKFFFDDFILNDDGTIDVWRNGTEFILDASTYELDNCLLQAEAKQKGLPNTGILFAASPINSKSVGGAQIVMNSCDQFTIGLFNYKKH